MRHYRSGVLFAMIALMSLSFLLTGCPSKKTDDDDDDTPTPKKQKTKVERTVETLKPVAAKAGYKGVIEGKVTWKGDLPELDQLTANLRQQFSANPDHKYCLEGKSFETEEYQFRIGKNNGLGNVFVWIMPETGYFFDVPKDQIELVPKAKAISQPHCAFLPHCTVLFPSHYKDGKQVPTGQELVIENDARVGHNANVQGGPLNGQFNLTLPAKTGDGPPAKLTRVLKPENKEITMSCNIHNWMRAYLRVFDHPYAAVTSVGGDPDKKVWENLESDDVGTYKIEGVPVGAKVKLFAWHETKGFLPGANGKVIELKDKNTENFEVSK